MDHNTKKRKPEENGVITISTTNTLTPEDARKIIEPFTKDQLLDILQSAALRHLDVLDSIRTIADRDPAQRKLFVRGLGWETTTESLRNIFSCYGEIADAIVVLDKATGKSKGYGFVIFKHIDGALLALKEPSKKIDGRVTVTQLAAMGNTGTAPAGPTSNPQPAVDAASRKIYVGNVPADMPTDKLLAHFASYGEIEEGPLGIDKSTGKFRGYAMFVYKTAEAARASLVDATKVIDGVQLFCKFANDGKKGKPAAATVSIAENAGGDGVASGLQGQPGQPPSSMPTSSVPSQYSSGLASYGGFPGAPHPGPAGMVGPQGMAHHHLNSSLQSSIGGPGLSSVPSSFGAVSGYGAAYGGLGGGPGAGGYGGLGSGPTPGAAGYGGLGSVPTQATGAYAGLGTGGSSLYRLPPSTVGLPSVGYHDGARHYSLSSSEFSSQHQQTSGTMPQVPRVPIAGMYPGMPPYY